MGSLRGRHDVLLPACAAAVLVQVLRNTKFASCPIVPMAAAVGGEKVAAVGPGTSGGGGGAPASVEGR